MELLLADLPRPLSDRLLNKLHKDVEFIISKNIPGLKEIYLFGSCARGDYRWDSDIDLAIITSEALEDRYLRGEISDILDYELDGVSTDVVFLTNDDDGISRVFNQVFHQDKKLIWKAARSCEINFAPPD